MIDLQGYTFPVKKKIKFPYQDLLERNMSYYRRRTPWGMWERLKAFVRSLGLVQVSCVASPPVPTSVFCFSSSLALFLGEGKSKPFSLPGGVRLNTEMATGKRLEGKTKDRGVRVIRLATELQACRTPIYRNPNRF